MDKSKIEIEKKYIIRMPDIKRMAEQKQYSAHKITQIYLSSRPEITHRVRMRLTERGAVYTETLKMRIDAMSAYEDEREITEEEYDLKSKDIADGTAPVEKTRHSFEYLGQIFEIDIYPQWKDTAIMETELDDRENYVVFPDFIEIIKDVTGDKRYSNAAMSRRFPTEESGR